MFKKIIKENIKLDKPRGLKVERKRDDAIKPFSRISQKKL